MRVPTQPRGFGLRFNITPLIDIVFLLIIFFLVSSHFVRSESMEPVDLPKAETTVDAPIPTNRLVVTIRSDGTYIVSGQPLSHDQFIQRLTSASSDDEPVEVQIRGDQKAPFQFVEPILLDCARLGLMNVKIIVLESDG